MSRLTVVIVSFNARTDLVRCLDSLHAHPPRIAHDIIVVDNGSGDGSAADVRQRFSGVTVLALEENVGFARANNLGIRATKSDLVLLLNPDTVVPAGAIDGLVAALLEVPDAAVAGPRLVDEAGRPELSFGSMVTPFAERRQKRLVQGAARDDPATRARIERMTATRRFPDWVSGACLLVWRQDAEAAGLLDERYFMYLEDVDFCAAVRARGRRILYTPDVVVTHLRGRSRAAAPAATQRAYRRSHLAFYAKHHPRWAPLLRWYVRLKGEAWEET